MCPHIIRRRRLYYENLFAKFRSYQKDYYKINIDDLINEYKKIEYILKKEFAYKIVLNSKAFDDFFMGIVFYKISYKI